MKNELIKINKRPFLTRFADLFRLRQHAQLNTQKGIRLHHKRINRQNPHKGGHPLRGFHFGLFSPVKPIVVNHRIIN